MTIPFKASLKDFRSQDLKSKNSFTEFKIPFHSFTTFCNLPTKVKYKYKNKNKKTKRTLNIISTKLRKLRKKLKTYLFSQSEERS